MIHFPLDARPPAPIVWCLALMPTSSSESPRAARIPLAVMLAASLSGLTGLAGLTSVASLVSLAGCRRNARNPVTTQVVVLGFDGADPKLLAKWAQAGKLPNLARLARTGTFSP